MKDTPEGWYELNNLKKSLPIDLKAELVANALTSDFNDKVNIALNGNLRRPISKEIEEIEVIESAGNDPFLQLNINREGIYDSLPPFMFHRVKQEHLHIDSQEFEKEIQNNRNVEDQARAFFYPIEQELFSLKCKIWDYETTLVKNQFLEYEQHRLMDKFWRFDPSFLPEDKSILVHILPFLVRSGHHLESINFCLSRLTGFEVSISFHQGREIKFRETKEISTLFDAVLGVDTILGVSYFDKDAVWANIEISLRDVEDYHLFTPGMRQRKLIDFVMSFLLPMEMEYEFKFTGSDSLSQHESLKEGQIYAALGIDSILEAYTETTEYY